MDQLTYLYAVVPADAPEPPAALRGLEDGPIRVLRLDRVAAVASTVPSTEYSDAALDARMDDLQWVGSRGVEHERVIDWYVEQGPAIPLSLFSIHADDGRAEARVRSGADEYERTLQRLHGHTEWGIKIWRGEAQVRERIDEISASLRQLTDMMPAADPGKRYLLERRRDSMRTEEIKALSKRLAHETYSRLAGAAARGVVLPTPAVPASGDRSLLLQAAFLVADAAYPPFQEEVTRSAHALSEAGFELEFTGPWPPYHFSAEDDD